MLTPETKRHIDNARQVLVGKVPDPKSQIEQITNALVYKFMDDMDEQAAALGGKRRYFTGDYEKYGWRKLMNEGLGAHERLILYREALESMSKNPNLPELFRSIFRNAYLPFNDARTLTLFLKEVEYFSYENSEELGNGYEYLLSIMGSQGDAGQFRTPRHIIDFIVECVNPTKDDSVLDPACGTAGFLISAYKHVMAKHGGVNDITGVAEQNEIPLTADEKRKLYSNYHGFDIDDNMVKMAKVNMYLHSFPDPHIEVHDTLSSEDHWNYRYDVILANPPFMTPKGGIVPHAKFGIKSSRAEVLFVDYIINHLKPSGRAGFIVPASISINDNAFYYSELRKRMVEEGLYAVVELHAYVFKPYAEVTTHILFFDRTIKNIQKIPLIKINNDGFDKSDIRKPIAGTELPQVVRFLRGEEAQGVNISYIEIAEFWQNENHYLSATLNSKSIIGAQNGSPIGDLIEECKARVGNGNYEVWSVSNKDGFVTAESYFKKRVASADIKNYKIIQPGYFAYNPSRINVGSIAYNSTNKIGAVSPMYQVFKIKENAKISGDYLIRLLKSPYFLEIINANIKGATRKVIKLDKLKTIHIPVPDPNTQKELIETIDVIENGIRSKELEIAQARQEIKEKIVEVWK